MKPSLSPGNWLKINIIGIQNCDYREFVEITEQQTKEIIDKARIFIAESQQALKKLDL